MENPQSSQSSKNAQIEAKIFEFGEIATQLGLLILTVERSKFIQNNLSEIFEMKDLLTYYTHITPIYGEMLKEESKEIFEKSCEVAKESAKILTRENGLIIKKINKLIDDFK